MGCFCSKGEGDKQSFQPHQSHAYNAGDGGGCGAQVTHVQYKWNLFESIKGGGMPSACFGDGARDTKRVQRHVLQVYVSTAGLLSSSPLSRLHVVDVKDDGIFAALFDAHGSKDAAEFCTDTVLQVSSPGKLLFW